MFSAPENSKDANVPVEAKGELYWDDGESWVESIDDYDHHHCQFAAKVTKAEMEVTIKCEHKNVIFFFK